MNEIGVNEIFNERNFTVFTDASSIRQPNGKYITSSAYMIYIGDNLIGSGVHIFRDSTISIGELYAVLQGVYNSFILYNELKPTNVYLFSDSKYSISSLTEWFPRWAKESIDGCLMSYSGKEVMNQQIIQSIISFILLNNYEIKLLKIRGHVENEKKLTVAKEYIEKNNLIFQRRGISESVNNKICYLNNMVDLLARNSIQEPYITKVYLPSAFDMTTPIFYPVLEKDDVEKYISLVQ